MGPLSHARQSRVVFINWRDMRHPRSGGAELYCESVARRMAARGTRVTLLTARPKGLPRREEVEGVEIRRMGSTLGVYPRVLFWLFLNRWWIDRVVDCQNGIPFYSPLALRRKTAIVCLIFHVHQEQFNVYFPWPFNRIGQFLEGRVCRAVYKRRPIVVISPSTRTDVRGKLKLKGSLFVVPCGMDQPATPPAEHERAPTARIAWVGRLVPHKQMDLLVEALPEVLSEHADLQVDIAGAGPSLEELKSKVDALGIRHAVRLHGRVSDNERDLLLRQAWLTVNPSAGEGWGLSVIEANSCGIPAIAFRVPGLQDAIVEGQTGWLVPPVRSLAPTIRHALRVLRDPAERAAWGRRANDWSRRFDWNLTTARFDAILQDESHRLRSGGEREARVVSDLACVVELPASAVARDVLARAGRRTDVWRWHEGDQVRALLHGADETGVRIALDRLEVRDQAVVRPARHVDWLMGGRTAP
jgi:glycosyltransferase involved in cell wall biosynthesis